MSHFLRNNFTGRHARSSCDVSRGAAAVLSQLIWANLHYEFSKPSVNLGATSWKNLTTKAPPPPPVPNTATQATSNPKWIRLNSKCNRCSAPVYLQMLPCKIQSFQQIRRPINAPIPQRVCSLLSSVCLLRASACVARSI